MKVKPTFTCKECGKVYRKEASYIVHECKEMRRSKLLKRPVGQLAFDYYIKWFRFQGKRAPDILTFKESNMFDSFIRFAEFVAKSNLPQPDKFIKYMISKTYQPTMWLHQDIYPAYLEHLDNSCDPMDMIGETVNTLLNIADEKEIDVADIFDHLTPPELISYIIGRKISPWLLLHSKKFKIFLQKLQSLDRTHFNAAIRINFWSDKISKNPQFTKKISKIVTALGI